MSMSSASRFSPVRHSRPNEPYKRGMMPNFSVRKQAFFKNRPSLLLLFDVGIELQYASRHDPVMFVAEINVRRTVFRLRLASLDVEDLVAAVRAKLQYAVFVAALVVLKPSCRDDLLAEVVLHNHPA